ncbi:MAG: glycoside hydrolase family 15 protein [Anaerolineae bacterium]|nr:glycoside hydrolase family 15 protein [Anaerolineae bacterium]
MNLWDSSITIIQAGQAASGAYVASPTFSQYGYCWLRDGTWTAYAMDLAGEHASAHAFHAWVGATLQKHAPRVEALLARLARGETPHDHEYLPTRFTLDGELGTDDWTDFQLDGYGAWLWGLVAHVEAAGDDALWETLRPAIDLTVRYLGALWSMPNYDCWEESRHQIHLSTLTALYGGLAAVARYDPGCVPAELPAAIQAFALEHGVTVAGYLKKSLGNEAVDASLLWAAVPYGLLSVTDPRFAATLAKIEHDLARPGGGVYRYAADTYYGGGEWVLLAAWLGWVYAELGRRDEAQQLLAWCEAQATAAGELPEQVTDHLLDASLYDGWVQRWGAVACPLLWSHAMYLILRAVLDRR